MLEVLVFLADGLGCKIDEIEEVLMPPKLSMREPTLVIDSSIEDFLGNFEE